MDLTLSSSYYDNYDPKKKSPARTRAARTRLAAALGVLAVVGVLLLMWGRGAREAAPAPPSAAGTSGRQVQGATASPSPPAAATPAARLTLSDRMVSVAPMYRGPGKIETFPGFANANRVLLATHNRLMWYRYDTDELRVIHEGQGVYYGVFTGEGRDALGAPTDMWVVSRPHNWKPTSTKEHLLHLSLETGHELGRVEIPSHFTHDAVRRRNKVYVCNTAEGSILEYNFPDMRLERELKLFTREEHVNTLAPTVDDRLWAVLHNMGQKPSSLAEIDLKSGKVLRRIEGVGQQAHGLVFWDVFAVLLDSQGGRLLRVNPRTSEVATLWELGDPRFFLKGLSVVDDIAFFGIAPMTQRADRGDPTLNCHLAAYDLKERVLLWWRQLPTHGLLNVVAAPHLAVESTAYSMNTAAQINYKTKPNFSSVLAKAKEAPLSPLAARGEQEAGAVAQQRRSAREVNTELDGGWGRQRVAREVEGRQAQLGGWDSVQAPGGRQQRPAALRLSISEMLPRSDPLSKYPPRIGGYWSSGWPRLDLAGKELPGFEGGLQLLLYRTDVTRLKEHLLSLPDADWTDEEQAVRNAFITGRNQNLGDIKPGARSIMLQFSSHNGDVTARFPWYYRFQPYVEPLLLQLLGEGSMANIIRMQFAIMAPHTQIKLHQDMGGYASRAHRIHVVIATNPQVVFAQCAADGRGLGAGRDVVAATAALLAAGGRAGVDGDSGCVPIRVAEEGLVFELNNRLKHYVVNGGDEPRIHLVVDVAESPRQPIELRVGQTCDYSRGSLDC